MAILSEITFYPIKSCAGIALSKATLTRAGVRVEVKSGALHDREWMLVDAGGLFLTQREHPRLALVTPRITETGLHLTAPGMLELELPFALPEPPPAGALMVQVWDDRVQALDCGDAAAAWFARAIGTHCRLVRFDPAAVRCASAKWTGGVAAPTRFSDGYPLLVIGTASLLDLNQKLLAVGRSTLPMNRFRPNLVLDGIEAFEEDYAASFEFGAMRLKPVKPCPRCPIPAIDQATGLAGPDPLDILQRYRAKPELDGAVCFGINSIVIEGDEQSIHVGQEVNVTLVF